jgi:hypothetical protein
LCCVVLCRVVSCRVVSCLVLSRLVLFCLVLSCLVCPALCCVVLCCVVLSWLRLGLDLIWLSSPASPASLHLELYLVLGLVLSRLPAFRYDQAKVLKLLEDEMKMIGLRLAKLDDDKVASS